MIARSPAASAHMRMKSAPLSKLEAMPLNPLSKTECVLGRSQRSISITSTALKLMGFARRWDSSVKLCLMDTHLGTAWSAARFQSLLTVAQTAIALRPGRKVKTVTSRSSGRVPAEGTSLSTEAHRQTNLLAEILCSSPGCLSAISTVCRCKYEVSDKKTLVRVLTVYRGRSLQRGPSRCTQAENQRFSCGG